jgi:hypothetical protein
MRKFVYLLTALVLISMISTAAQESLSENATVFATGLNNPRGLVFGPDGYLYVAEAGLGGTESTDGVCEQVPPPLGPITGGFTSRISKIDADGQLTTVAAGLPSGQTSEMTGNEVLGAADVAFVDGVLYALIQAGCTKGHLEFPNAVVQVNEDETTPIVADLSTYYRDNPVNFAPDEDHDVEGNPYSMISYEGMLYVVEANHDELDRVMPDGTIERVGDIAGSIQAHVTTTAVAVGPDGNFYVGSFSPLPYVDGTAQIFQVTPEGEVSVFASDLTTIADLVFDCSGNLYVLEASTGNILEPPFIVPGSGKILRKSADSDTFETLSEGLTFPTAMTFGPDNFLYVSNIGFAQGTAVGKGEILKVDVGVMCE